MSTERLLAALIAMHNANHADAAEHIAHQLGIHYEYACWCYGDMSTQEYTEMIEAGRQYALEHANDYGDSVIGLRAKLQG